MGYDEVGSGMVRTSLVLLPSLLPYPHVFSIATAPHIPVVLVDAKKLDQ